MNSFNTTLYNYIRRPWNSLMVDGGLDNPRLSPQMKVVCEANLTADDQKAIVEFLKSLSGEYPIVEPPKLP